MNEEKDLAYVGDLTEAQVNEICADLLARGNARLADAEKAYSYLEEYGKENPESARTALAKVRDATREIQEHAKHARELREYWASKHPEQTL